MAKNKKKVLTLETVQRMSKAELNKSRSVVYINKLFTLLQNEFPSMLGNYIVVTSSKMEELGIQGTMDLCDLSGNTSNNLEEDLASIPGAMRGTDMAKSSMSVAFDANLIVMNDFYDTGLSITEFIHEIAHITATSGGKVFTTTAHGYTHIINKLKLLGLDQMFLNGTIAERRAIIDKAIVYTELIVAGIELTLCAVENPEMKNLSVQETVFAITHTSTTLLQQHGFKAFEGFNTGYANSLVNMELEGSDIL